MFVALSHTRIQSNEELRCIGDIAGSGKESLPSLLLIFAVFIITQVKTLYGEDNREIYRSVHNVLYKRLIGSLLSTGKCTQIKNT